MNFAMWGRLFEPTTSRNWRAAGGDAGPSGRSTRSSRSSRCTTSTRSSTRSVCRVLVYRDEADLPRVGALLLRRGRRVPRAAGCRGSLFVPKAVGGVASPSGAGGPSSAAAPRHEPAAATSDSGAGRGRDGRVGSIGIARSRRSAARPRRARCRAVGRATAGTRPLPTSVPIPEASSARSRRPACRCARPRAAGRAGAPRRLVAGPTTLAMRCPVDPVASRRRPVRRRRPTATPRPAVRGAAPAPRQWRRSTPRRLRRSSSGLR